MSYKIQKSQPFTISDLRKLEKKENKLLVNDVLQLSEW
ncbi:unnamed protein product [Bacillus thuringiensis DB27]|uniref:Uncharacterized protein n=1 Tax=Bacillus thuringiensis DB27 TaxID=1431339 RepID=W8XYJ1_BACTU|nr:unnamed protein product [Bacillus thuringiensis DB27]